MYNYFEFENTHSTPSAREIILSVRAKDKKMALLRAMFRDEVSSQPKRTSNPLKALLSFLTASKAQRQLAGASRK